DDCTGLGEFAVKMLARAVLAFGGNGGAYHVDLPVLRQPIDRPGIVILRRPLRPKQAHAPQRYRFTVRTDDPAAMNRQRAVACDRTSLWGNAGSFCGLRR